MESRKPLKKLNVTTKPGKSGEAAKRRPGKAAKPKKTSDLDSDAQEKKRGRAAGNKKTIVVKAKKSEFGDESSEEDSEPVRAIQKPTAPRARPGRAAATKAIEYKHIFSDSDADSASAGEAEESDFDDDED